MAEFEADVVLMNDMLEVDDKVGEELVLDETDLNETRDNVSSLPVLVLLRRQMHRLNPLPGILVDLLHHA